MNSSETIENKENVNNRIDCDDTSNINQEETLRQLNEYLNKFIEMVPNLKQMDQREKVKRILFSIQASTPSDERNDVNNVGVVQDQLDSFKSLQITPKTTSLSELQILQSVLDYILELKCSLHD
jgi:hypothetical protein